MSDITRRDFLESSTRKIFALTATGSWLAARQPVRAVPPSERLILAAIGVGGRGSSLVRGFAERGDCTFSHFADLDPGRGAQLLEQVTAKQGSKPERVLDYRRVLDSKDVDAVINATPDHWHGPLSIYACMAGKDVYVEKPPCHNVWEGRKMVEFARHHRRIVQVGTQNRSAPYVKKALEFIRQGGIGKIHLCKVFNLKGGGPYREPPDSDPPPGVDYNTWLGAAPLRPFNRGHFHGNWHKYWTYSGGDMADDGVHQLDVARWLVGKDFPRSVSGTGGKYAFQDDREVPDTQVVTYDFGDLAMTFELTQYARYMKKTNGQIRGGSVFPHWPQNATRIELYGTKNLMTIGRHGGGWQVFAADGKVVAQEYGRFPDVHHKENFVQAVRSRELPSADVEEGHRSAVLVHLGNIATRLGRKLDFDGKTERITNDREADRMLKRNYRKPFTIPEVT